MNKKIIFLIFFGLFLSGCVQTTAILGPVYTFGTTGNALQAGLSYGSNKAIKKAQILNKEKKLDRKKNLELHDFLKKQIVKTRQKLKIIK